MPDNPDHFLSPFLDPFAGDTLAQALEVIISVLMFILFPIIVMMIVYAGFLFVTAQGKPENLKKARSALVWGVIGGLIILGAQAFSIAIRATVDSFI